MNEISSNPELLEETKTYISSGLELYKIRVDLYKHLSTISGGSLVVLTTFSGNFINHGESAFLIVALLTLILTIITSAWTCFFTLGLMMKMKDFLNDGCKIEKVIETERGVWIGNLSLILFVLSFAFLVTYMIQQITTK